MTRSFLCCMIALSSLTAQAQVKKTEITQTTSPAQDAKGLSPDMPDSTALSTKIERIVLVRFRNQADILAGLERHIKEQKIKNGVILSGIGSVVAAHYHVVSNRGFPSKNLFIEDPTASADIVNVSGMILNGKLHPHIAFGEPDKMYGGHLEPRTLVFTFAAITIGVLPDDIDISRYDDKNWR